MNKTNNGFVLVLEQQILLFTVIVSVFATASFFWGGVCALWQWIVALVLTVAWPWFRRTSWREALVGSGLFALVYLGLVLTLAMTIDWASGDHLNYHFEVIRLLCEGWNPVTDADLTKITSAFGIMKTDPGMGYHHVAFTARTIAVFNAVAYQALKNPYSLTYPLVYFLSISVILRAFLAFLGKRMLTCVVFFILALWHFIDFARHVDGSAMLASAGLLLTIYQSLRQKRTEVVPLLAYTFWMACLKLPCAVTAFLFWVVYFGACVGRDRANWKRLLGQFAAWGLIVGVAFSIASFNPYGTSYRDYGHPLYPFKTVDPQKYPVHDITGDFNIGNDDYHKMGWAGLWLNAFVSSDLVQRYYCHKFGQKEFKPHSLPWGDYQDPYVGVDTPVQWKKRMTIWVAFFVLLAIPRTRPLAPMLLLSLFVLPKQHIGYLRYMPWLEAFRALVLTVLLELIVERWRWASRLALVGIVLLLVLSFVGHLPLKADVIYQKYYETRQRPMEVFNEAEFTGLNNSLLLMHQLGRKDVKVALATKEERKGMRESPFGYYVREPVPFELPKRERSGSFKRYRGYIVSLLKDPMYSLRAFIVIYPKMVLKGEKR